MPVLRICAATPTSWRQEEDALADKEQFKGKFNEAAGSVKSGVGKMAGDDQMRAEGEAQKAKGKVQGFVGGAKDKAREFGDKAKANFEGVREAAKEATH